MNGIMHMYAAAQTVQIRSGFAAAVGGRGSFHTNGVPSGGFRPATKPGGYVSVFLV